MRTFSSLLEVTFMAQEGVFWIRYSAASVRQCIGCASLCLSEGELYIHRPQKPSGPNLLDEPLKGFIVNPACSPWKCFESYKPEHMGITTHSESVQPLQSVKLVYQSCSRSRAALEPLRNKWWTLTIRMMKMLINDYCLCYLLFMFTWSCVYMGLWIKLLPPNC